MSSGYRASHTHADKGAQYAADFERSPWLRYAMSREATFLREAVRRCEKRDAYLDFACGTGRILRQIGPEFANAVGVDISTSMLDAARAATTFRLVEGDLTRDRALLGGQRFDFISAFRFFPNAEPQLRREAMKTLVLHLAPDGLLVFNNHQNSTSTLHIAFRLMGKRAPWTPMHHSEVIDLLDEVGMAIIDTHVIGVLPATDRRMMFPDNLHSLADRIAARAPALSRRLGHELIYVARRHQR